MNKKYDVYEIMDNYNDNEFNEIRWASVDTKSINKKVMERIKPQKRLKLKTKVIIAVAAAAVVVSVITAAAINEVIYTSPSGEGFYVGNNSWGSLGGGSEATVYKIEDGRVYFIADNQHTDITDLISDDKIYWYQTFFPDSKGNDVLCIIAVSGTVDSGILYNEFIMDSYSGNQSIDSRHTSITGIVDENNKISYDAVHEMADEISFMRLMASCEYYNNKNLVCTLENDRVLFTYDGQNTDITDIIDNDTPYIYSCNNDMTYVIVGGEKEDLGYLVIDPSDSVINGESDGIFTPNSTSCLNYVTFIRTEDKAVIKSTDIFTETDNNETEFDFNKTFNYTAHIEHEFKPWVLNGFEQIKSEETRDYVDWDWDLK